MDIGIIGTGNLATALATGWVRAGHDVVVSGRSRAKADAAAQAAGARAGTPAEAAAAADAVLLAVRWEGVEDALALAGAGTGALAGRPLIDPTNAVAHGVGELLVPQPDSAATRIAALAPGAHVVKAFHLFPTATWTSPQPTGAVVTLAGDDPAALETVAALARDVGGRPVVVGGLARARQLEEAAGMVIALAHGGENPAAAVPAMA